MMEKTISLIIGYLFGCFLTADVIAKKHTGHNASALGDTGNPGMANIMASLGFAPGIWTLAGDLGKCIIASLISYALFRHTGRIVVLYAGLGCTIGHDFPFWRAFRGGKGVATTSIAIVLYAFGFGLMANIAGMLVVFATRYLCIGGPVIPLSFAVMMALRKEREAAVLAVILSVLSVKAHGSAIRGIRGGKTKQTDVIGAIRKKFGRHGEQTDGKKD